MKYILFYETAEDFAPKAQLHMPAHREQWQTFSRAGTLLMIGPFANAQEGAMGIFTSAEAAETFAKTDPFVLGGVVARWYVRAWNEVLFPDAADEQAT